MTLDLKNDPSLIQQYIDHHRQVWPEVKDNIKMSHITQMEIYHVANRLMMLIETTADFSFELKHQLDSQNVKVQEWEKLMDNYQSHLPFALAGSKWVLMNKIFQL